MDTFIKSIKKDCNGNVIKAIYTADRKIQNAVLSSLARNNTFMPGIKSVVFNGPFTKVFFQDGTSVSLKATDGLKRDSKGKVLVDSKTGKPKTTCEPDKPVRDAAIAYAVFKRAYGRPDEKGEIKGDGFSTYVRKVVESAFDQGKFEAEQKAKREAKKVEKRKAEQKSKDKGPKISQDKKTGPKVKKSIQPRLANGRFA